MKQNVSMYMNVDGSRISILQKVNPNQKKAQ